MGDDDITMWGGELDCSETGYSPRCLVVGDFSDVRRMRKFLSLQ